MRLVTLLACLLLPACHAEYYVLGDSISSPRHSWANTINAWGWKHPDAGFPYMMINAVPGQTLTGFDFPDHIGQAFNMQGKLLDRRALVIALGTNDAGFGVPLAEFESALAAMLALARERHLPVVCILAFRVDHVDTTPYREIQKAQCPQWVDLALDLSDSRDGLHPGPAGHERLARDFLSTIGGR